MKEYAVYKSEELVCIGTLEECAEYRGVSIDTMRYYLTGAYQNKIAKRKNARNFLTVIELEDDEDEFNNSRNERVV